MLISQFIHGLRNLRKKNRQLTVSFPFLPFSPLSLNNFATEFTDQKAFSRNTHKLLLKYAATFRKVNIYLVLQSFKFELVLRSAGLSNPENQPNWLIYAGIHLSPAKSSAGSSQNQSGNLIKMKTVVAKYT